MTGYRRFKISGGVPANAKIAKIANDRSGEDQISANISDISTLAAAHTTKAKIQESPFVSFVSDQDRHVFGIDKLPEPDRAEIEERKGMAMGGVPEPYLDAWARLQVQKPVSVTNEDWRQAIDDAGKFLGQWGALADTFGWSPGDLFDAARWRHGPCLVAQG